jgi:hypothetical protein
MGVKSWYQSKLENDHPHPNPPPSRGRGRYVPPQEAAEIFRGLPPQGGGDVMYLPPRSTAGGSVNYPWRNQGKVGMGVTGFPL